VRFHTTVVRLLRLGATGTARGYRLTVGAPSRGHARRPAPPRSSQAARPAPGQRDLVPGDPYADAPPSRVVRGVALRSGHRASTRRL